MVFSSWRCQVLMPQPYRWGFERTTLEWDTSIAYTTNVTLISASLRQLSWLELGATELGILSDWNDVITNLPHQTQSQVSPLWMALLALKSAHEGLLISSWTPPCDTSDLTPYHRWEKRSFGKCVWLAQGYITHPCNTSLHSNSWLPSARFFFYGFP